MNLLSVSDIYNSRSLCHYFLGFFPHLILHELYRLELSVLQTEFFDTWDTRSPFFLIYDVDTDETRRWSKDVQDMDTSDLGLGYHPYTKIHTHIREGW